MRYFSSINKTGWSVGPSLLQSFPLPFIQVPIGLRIGVVLQTRRHLTAVQLRRSPSRIYILKLAHPLLALYHSRHCLLNSELSHRLRETCLLQRLSPSNGGSFPLVRLRPSSSRYASVHRDGMVPSVLNHSRTCSSTLRRERLFVSFWLTIFLTLGLAAPSTMLRTRSSLSALAAFPRRKSSSTQR